MTTLGGRLVSTLEEVMPVRVEEDGALTIQHGGTFASLRVVRISDDLELVSLSQVLAWDLKPDKRIRTEVAKHARETLLGTVTMVDNNDHADVMLRYNFPGTGLSDEALRMLVLMVLSAGVEVREAIVS